MDLESYVIQVLQEHLLTPDYSQLSQTEMKHRMSNLRSTLQSIITTNQDKLSKAEITYFQRSRKTHFRLPIFYGLPKVHKML
jgi:Holliday junction resolvasome RuvABC endonuclease subunit